MMLYISLYSYVLGDSIAHGDITMCQSQLRATLADLKTLLGPRYPIWAQNQNGGAVIVSSQSNFIKHPQTIFIFNWSVFWYRLIVSLKRDPSTAAHRHPWGRVPQNSISRFLSWVRLLGNWYDAMKKVLWQQYAAVIVAVVASYAYYW